MNRIRIGKDFKIRWSIKDNATGAAYDLENRNLILYLNTPRERVTISDYTISGNLIEWIFKGKDQKQIGLYSLVLIENNGEIGMCTVDTMNAFALVAHSHEEQLTSVDNVSIDVIELDGTIGIAPHVALSDWSINEEGYGYVKNRTHYEGVVKTITKAGDYEFEDKALKVVYHGPNGDVEYNLVHGSSEKLSEGPLVVISYRNQVLTVTDQSGNWVEAYPIYVYGALKKLDEKFIPGTIARSEDLAKVSESVQEQINNIPIAKGEADNSAVLKGGNNQALSEHSVAVGSNNVVGLKGFYYKHIRFVTNTLANVYLSRTQVIPTITTGGESKDTTIIPSDYYSKGDTISIVNDNKYDDIATINNMSEGMIQIKWNSESPFTEIKKETDLSPEDYTIYSLDKPDKGLADIGKYSFATGTDNKAINSYAEVSGKGNVARSKFARVWGKNNIGGYNTTTFGTNNINLADNSTVAGTNNINEGSNSTVVGNKNKNYGKRSVITGDQNTNISINGTVLGESNIAGSKGYYCYLHNYPGDNIFYIALYPTVSKDEQILKSSDVGWKTGDILSFFFNEKRYYFKIIQVSDWDPNEISEGMQVAFIDSDGNILDEPLLPSIPVVATSNFYQYSVINISQPDKGVVDFGAQAYAEGKNNNSINENSHAEGVNTKALGMRTHSEGTGTIAHNDNEHAQGKHNKSNILSTIHSVGIGTSDTDRKNAHEITIDGKHYIFNVGGYDGTNPTESKDLATVLNETDTKLTELEERIENINPAPMLSVTYAELVALRDNGELIAGMQYRITDYVTTTAQENTQSAGHQFDVIVLALTNDTLAERAWACHHVGDTYFQNSHLEAWQIWYCLDNDTSRFVWAVPTSEGGKGVIYRMIDEFNNDCPYDFKNIMFIRYELAAPETVTDDKWLEQMSANIQDQFALDQLAYIWGGIDNSDRFWEDDYAALVSKPTGNTEAFFTFSRIVNNEVFDNSLNPTCYDNSIRKMSDVAESLSNNVFFATKEYTDCCANSLGSGCYANSLGDECSHNRFGDVCAFNTLGDECGHNIFGNDCKYNSFGKDCDYNCFGKDCNYNCFRNRCLSNRFGYACSAISFGDTCYGNSFGYACSAISFGDTCYGNSFGCNCYNIQFGSRYYANTIGNGCNGIIFLTSEDELIAYVSHNSFGDGCRFIRLFNDETASSSQRIQNYRIANGMSGTADVTRGLAYETTIAKATDGTIKQFNLADFTN